MILVQQVLDRPLAELRVSDLTGHGLAVRRLIGCIDELPARGKAVLKELVDQMEWSTPGSWDTCTEEDTERHKSPSAAQLGMLIGRSDRTVRRAYEDAEELGLLTRHHRGWSTNRFTLHLSKLLELAQKSQAGRLEKRLAMLRAWQGGYQDERGKFAPRPTVEGASGHSSSNGAKDAGTQVPRDTLAADAGGAPPAQLSAEQLAQAFADFPGEEARRLVAVLEEARRLVAARGVLHWKSLQATRREHRLELGALCIAVHTLGHPKEPADERIRRAGTWAGRLGAAWAEMGHGPIAYVLRDVAAFQWKWGTDWAKKARPSRWAQHVEEALAHLRRWRPYAETPLPACPDVAEPAPAQGDGERSGDLADVAAAQVESALMDADDGPPPPSRAEVRAVLDRRTRDVARWRGALEQLPPLPEVSGPPHDPERRRVNAERLARVELSRALEGYARAAMASDLQALQEALQQAEHAAEALGVATPP